MKAGSAASTSSPPRLGGYGELTRRVREQGLLRPRPASYARHAGLVFGSLAATVAVMAIWRDSWWLLALAPVMAVLSTQTGFLGHDVGHLQVTRDARRSRLLGLVVGDLMTGLSFGWWVAKHNAHHAHPNDLENDPDVRVGVIVFDPDQALALSGTPRWVVRHQAWLFFPLLLAEAVNLHVASVRALVAPGIRLRAAEAVMLSVHFIAYVSLLLFTLTWPQALVFVVLHKGLQGLYLGISFAPNHKGMPTLSGAQAEDPLLRQVLTSRNVRGGPFIDVALGGLNYQIEHHLFPSMPRANLRRAQPIVREFCAEAGIEYVECSAFGSYQAAIGHLHHVGAGLRQD